MKKSINVQSIIHRFKFNMLNLDKIRELREVEEPAIKRIGLELSGALVNDKLARNLIGWGTSESIYFTRLGKKKTIAALEQVLKYRPPIIVLSKGFEKTPVDWVVEVANKFDIPVAWQNQSLSTITSTVGAYLSEFFAKEVQLHGCLVSISNIGVLITGPSGVGKSEAVLELIQNGHIFVSDDAVIIKQLGMNFIGRSPEITKSLLEVRGIGLIDVKFTYGAKVMSDSAQIKLVVELVNQDLNLDRLGVDYLKEHVLEGYIDKIQIPIKKGGSIASLIETAVNTYIARQNGVKVIDILNRRARNA
ncbi:HPr kinase/phosphorylase [Mycoplasmopsis californica]|uniref:HPr(Ser) kinase/phosphatase n=1 Tax=Mycoplasmopsis equigenitalium TaxID=114883 RepID=A0ABY5J4S3_9BACT|nr:HPr(Ser) kinase/phosphatase [Mycoplasmopsis equigenitalium]UUD37132.1 HPr(Ser) kinase/phosphatase [Mycoplasmopsis equigenitalium]VEU69562.1 HPr kinase/phosphorylase [Mycoplasmopsis californica]